MKKVLSAAILGLLLHPLAAAANGNQLDYPHSTTNNVNCADCHYTASLTLLDPSWTNDPPANIDDLPYNNFCWNCHDGSAAQAVETHSSRTTSEQYGQWNIECRTCHWPHHIMQYREYGAESFEESGTSQTVTSSTLTVAGTPWSVDQFKGYILMPDISKATFNYKIDSNTENTITVTGSIDTAQITAGNTFAIIYGNLVNATISTPNSGDKQVKFFRAEGANSFADGDATYNGPCEVCHTKTDHFRNDGSGPDQNHDNFAGGKQGSDCVGACHSHVNGFAHGQGSGGPDGCVACHGHEAGTQYDPDMMSPYTADPTKSSQGRGTTQSHSTHTEIDADDLKGPGIYCDDCHDITNIPYFSSGTDVNLDGRISLDETDVCDPCHSPGGSYDGLNDPDVGAKVIWKTGAYADPGTLRPGKEKWCATCHDESPAVIRAVPAPNVVGNENVESVYGTGYGYYKTGHGLASDQTYPSSGGIVAGAGKECSDCHDFTTAHIDGDARTFNDGNSSTTDPSYYRLGYRLILVNGQEPMQVPLPLNTSPLVNADETRLCFNTGCHTATGPFLNGADMGTNLVTDGVNRHYYHLEMNQIRYSSDYDGVNNSRITCVVCHNVHGSERLAMVRDGKLINSEPGLEIWYGNEDIVFYNTSNASPPEPDNIPLSASIGTVWIGNSSINLCSHCHANANTVPEYRTPHQDAALSPVLSWTGENGYSADGANPDNAAAGTNFIFRVNYTDKNNDPPTAIEVWVDKDDSSVYDPAEVFPLSEADAGDFNFVDGKIYKTVIPLAKAGDNVFSYRFYASDGGLDATGAPTSDLSVSLTGNAPVLSWTGEQSYENDGVNPNPGGNGAAFEFRINYTDLDNECPPASGNVEVWIDENDDATYDLLEKHSMAEADGDVDCTDGKLYTFSKALSSPVDGNLNYRFYADDGATQASENAAALSDNSLEISSDPNTPPTLSWVGAPCTTNGAKPAKGVDGGSFEFTVEYTDFDNECPSIAGQIQVWVDANNDEIYDISERYDLAEVDALDLDCSDGKLYSTTRQLNLIGDGVVGYLFTATDGTAAADGPPTLENTVTVVNGFKVRPSGGTGWYSTIQSAINASSSGGSIYVYEGTYAEDVFTNKTNLTIESVCGADQTIIDGSTYAVKLQFSNNTVLKGFSLTGAVNGLELNGSNPVYIQDCKIFNNSSRGIYSGNSSASLQLSGSEVYSNNGLNGAGIYLNGGVHAISDSVIRNNIAGENGGGLYLNTTGTGTSFVNTIIKDNQSGLAGGGIYANNAKASFSKCEFRGNSASTNGGAFILPNSGCAFDFENSIIAGNSATTDGGAFYSNAGVTSFNNCTIADNTAVGNGGAIALNCIGVGMTNSVVWNNYAVGYGHNIYKTSCGAPASTIEYTDIVSEIWHVYDYFGGAYSFVNGMTPAVDPFFAAPDNYHLLPNSGVIDMADPATAAADDIDGDARPQGAAPDMGADEAIGGQQPAGAGVEPVVASASSAFEVIATGAVILVPGDFSTIQAAVDAAADGDEILVGDGAYPETINFKGKAIAVASENGPANCSITAATFKNGEGRSSLLSGFSFASDNKAIQIINSSPTISGCVISGINGATDGVIEIAKGSPLITGCIVTGNSSAIAMAGANPAIENTLVAFNSGNGVQASNSSPSIVNCTIRANASNDLLTGGGIYSIENSTIMVINSIIWGNTPNQIQVDGGTADVSYSLAPGFAGEGNIEGDPLFIGEGDSRLSQGSPCVDAGTSVNAPAADLEGNTRPMGAGVDIGAYEMQL